MKLIIAGSRTIQVSPLEIKALLDHYNLKPSEIVSGTANGVDKCGEFYAGFYHKDLARFPADWDQFGKSAGHRRNQQMAEYADALLLIWDGKSRGSAGMKACMEKLNKPIYEAVEK